MIFRFFSVKMFKKDNIFGSHPLTPPVTLSTNHKGTINYTVDYLNVFEMDFLVLTKVDYGAEEIEKT